MFALFVLEFAVRLLPSPPKQFEHYDDTYICSPTMGWLGRPNYQGQLTREEYAHEIRFNQQGMYDTDHDFAKPPDTTRILWVGDSFAQALQVAEPETAHQQLEAMLNQRHGRPDLNFEVISSGVMGWGTGQELVYYREQGRRYQPDIVLLLFFMGNDVNNNLPGHALTIDGFNCFAPYFPVCETGQLDSEPWYHVPSFEPAWANCSPYQKGSSSLASHVQQNSYLFARLEPLLLARNPRRSYGQRFSLPFAALYLPEESAEVQYGWQVTEGLLQQFQHEVQADGAEFMVAIVGPREVVWLAQLTTEQLQSFYQSDPDFVGATIDYPNRRLLRFLRANDIPALDLQQPMIDHMAQTGAKLYLPIDRHWTAEGNRFAATLLAEWLEKR